MIDQNTKTYKYRRRLSNLNEEFEPYRQKWKTIAQYASPNKLAFLEEDNRKANKGDRQDSLIVNNTATIALRVLVAGMQTGLTPQSLPWFNLSLADKQLAEYQPVREWLYQVRDIVLTIKARAGFYKVTPFMYENVSMFGTAPMMILEDFQKVVRYRPFSAGEYRIAQDHNNEVNVLHRTFSMKGYQIVEKFGLSNVSEQVKNAYNNGSEDRFMIVHCIEPVGSGKFEDVYFELAGDPNTILNRGKFNSQPFVCPRWNVEGTDVYGWGPGDVYIGDGKQLQTMEREKLQSLAMFNRPLLNVPNTMEGKDVMGISGGINYYDPVAGSAGVQPAYQVKPDLGGMANEGDRVERRIQNAFYNDVFRAVTNVDRQSTAYEIARIHEEALRELGPLTERIQGEFLDPAISRVFEISKSFGLIPPVPKELEGQPINVEYTSIFAQAQKAIGTASIERSAAFVASLSQLIPTARDKFDADEAIDRYTEMIGTPPSLILSDDKVKEIRQVNAQLEQAAQMLQNAPQMAKGAKDLASVKQGQGSVLDMLLQQQQ